MQTVALTNAMALGGRVTLRWSF